MKLSKHKLGELIEVTRGASLSGQFYAEEGELIRLTLGNFNMNGGGFKENTSKTDLYYTGTVKDEFILNKGDIITPLTEQSLGLLGTTARIPENGKYIQSQDVALVKCKEGLLDPNFCYYLISSSIVRQQLSAGAQQTKIRHTSPDKIKDCTVWVPEFEEQKRIGRILTDIDEKITLNRQINDNLEAMAKQLYDYWFVQFDFPNEEGKPYKSSGGAMAWNEKLKREIPQGLGAPKIGDIEKNIITGKTPSCADEDNFGGDIPFVTIDDIRGNLFVFEAQRTLSTKGADSQEKKYLPIGSLSVSCIGTIGVMGFVARLAQTNQQINSIVFEHEYNKEYLYFSLRLYFENAKAKTGNVFANMSKEEFASIIVAYPPKQILQAFHNKVAPIFDSIKNNIEEINALTKQRDELLPLLMNGQASVNYHLSVLVSPYYIIYRDQYK